MVTAARHRPGRDEPVIGRPVSPLPRSVQPPLAMARSVAASRVSDLGVMLTGFYTVVIVVAGASGIALLGWPGHSGSFFSWDLGASTAAATIGGLYLASVVTFAVALVRPRAQTRTVNWGILALAIPTLYLTLRHHQVFDWSRPQAVAWVVLFASAPTSIVLDLRTPAGTDASRPATRATRATLAALAIICALAAIALWVEPVRALVAPRSPIPLVGLTGRYFGAWCAFLATTAAAAAVRGRTSDARLVAVLFGSVSGATLCAAMRTIDDLGTNAEASVATIAVVGGIAVVLHRTNRWVGSGTDVSREATPVADEVFPKRAQGGTERTRV